MHCKEELPTITHQDACNLLEAIGYGHVSRCEKLAVCRALQQEFIEQRRRQMGSYRTLIHPLTAMWECFLSDPDCQPYNLRSRLAWPILHFCAFAYRYFARRLGDCPGVNDGLIVKWFWTHDPLQANILYGRSLRTDQVGLTARWLLADVRRRHEPLDLLLARLESGNIPPPDPATVARIDHSAQPKGDDDKPTGRTD